MNDADDAWAYEMTVEVKGLLAANLARPLLVSVQMRFREDGEIEARARVVNGSLELPWCDWAPADVVTGPLTAGAKAVPDTDTTNDRNERPGAS